MDHIQTIQEPIDENKEAIPTEVARVVMGECQKPYDEKPELYKLTWTVVDSHAHVVDVEDEDHTRVQLSHEIQTLIVEAVDDVPDLPFRHGYMKSHPTAMPHHGMMPRDWLKIKMMPHVMYRGNDIMMIIHSIVPYEPRKRARDD